MDVAPGGLTRPLLELPPVALPPPSGQDARPRSLAGRAALSVALLVGAVVLALAILVAVVGANVLLFQAGRVQLYLVLAAFAVVAALGRGFLAAARKPPEPPDEVVVPAADEPELHAEIARLAAAAGTRPPDRIVVVPAVNAYVREFGPMLGLVPGTRTLAIGTPLLDVLDVSELRAVLAHELGHLAGGDTRLGPVAVRTEQVLGGIIGSLGGGIIARVFLGYWKFQHKVNAAVRRGQEVVADRAAVRVAGRQAAADALRDVEVAARADDVFKYEYLAPLLQRARRPDDLVSGWRSLIADDARTRQLAESADADRSPIDPWASHPPTHERIRRIAVLPEEAAVARDPRAASSLFRDPERWIRTASDRWLQLAGIPEAREPVPWSAWGEVVARAEQAERAGDTDRALARLGLPAGIAGVHAALTGGRDRDLAAALVSGGWRAAGTDQRRSLLRAALVAVAAEEAARAGARWAISWSSPVELQSADGRSLELHPLADAAIDGDWEPLRAAIAPATSGATVAAPSPTPAPEPRAPDLAVGPPAPAPGTVGTLPQPPMPPFTDRVPDPYRWAVSLPGRVGQKVVIGVGEEGVGIGGGALLYERIAHVTTKVSEPSPGVTATITVQPVGGGPELRARVSTTGKHTGDILATVGYLWDLLGSRVGPRVRAAITEQIGRGSPVVVGGFACSPAGVALAKKPDRLVPWPEVGDAFIEHLRVHVPGATTVLSASISEPDAYLVRDLLPELRARFA
jgi:Zn-dependent protease with chaperone function